ncbi:bacilysin biosynthesis protein BacA [Bacillus altitudinis MN12]|uniref:bacilysin biosynthesis protein BacA n=1 Tax=Bacillus TaxID=1386 RepID=UPI00042F12D0|nr:MULTISPECIES: bacilysin biosynthesis protein BacA [Bacillus]AHL73221.1 bacilysin biosynthesis protein BacA [Bacillus pumilus]KOA81006.1 bacilysin biosynthesis protein BacA [Bacillus stratosphericus]KQU13472.1 bacilysin biosynthesis protein BacA [Bacillus sp. Leaf49]KSU74294.1 bacilysin biosynthesis protein BacA [Bacillus altitudinis]MBR0583357.1 bacilysin biosynthesis protein BacA [Bacillus altitudinis MN12]
MILKNDDVFHFKEEPIPSPKMFTVNTLGPKGTSSEYAAKHFISQSTTTLGTHTKLSLYDTFETCIEHTLSQPLQFTLVPHAYEGIKHFYMRPDLQLLQIFRCDTPMYGLAVRPDFPFNEQMLHHLKIVSHPAPVNLIQYFIHQNAEFELVNSTSTAAQKVRDGEFDFALTNEVARATYGLIFIRTFKSIPMSWSIFGKGEI